MLRRDGERLAHSNDTIIKGFGEAVMPLCIDSKKNAEESKEILLQYNFYEAVHIKTECKKRLLFIRRKKNVVYPSIQNCVRQRCCVAV